MALTLDHIVIAVHDLDKTIDDYAALGFTVVRGGEHPGRPTHNALVVFEDGAYFELIAWRSPAPQDRWWQLLDQHGEGIIDFALLPTSTAEVIAAAKARGLELQGPLDGGRLRPDGEKLQWQTGRPHTHDLPILCGDITPRKLRVPEGEVRQHANGATGVARLTVAVSDLLQSLERYRALLGDGAHIHAADGGSSATIALGNSVLELTQTAPQLQSKGEGPFVIALKGGTGSWDQAAAKLAHGAAIAFEKTELASKADSSLATA